MNGLVLEGNASRTFNNTFFRDAMAAANIESGSQCKIEDTERGCDSKKLSDKVKVTGTGHKSEIQRD
jgi:hypothetical protein